MNFLKKLFGSRSHTSLGMLDPDLGQFDSDFVKGSDVTWLGNAQLFGKTIEILINGNQNGLFPIQKKFVLDALANEEILKTESEIAISEEYKNAQMNFKSLHEQLEVKAISANDNGFELSFEQKETPYYYFNVMFENNKQKGVSIDS